MIVDVFEPGGEARVKIKTPLAPIDICTLLRAYSNREPWPGRDEWPRRGIRVEVLSNYGLIIDVDRPHKWETTKKGDILVKWLCQTPMPVQQWVDPREEADDAVESG